MKNLYILLGALAQYIYQKYYLNCALFHVEDNYSIHVQDMDNLIFQDTVKKFLDYHNQFLIKFSSLVLSK